jgi:hypothetical protein
VYRQRIDGARYWHNQPQQAARPAAASDTDPAPGREATDFELPSPRD